MQFLENEIRQITQWIWAATLDREIQPGHHPDWQARQTQTLMGSVRITGDWEGAVTLNCSTALARQIAAIMFGIPEQATTIEQTQDALGELTNMVGGNIKALLPVPSRLSLPTVAEGVDYLALLPGGRVISEVNFECLGEPFFVILLKSEKPCSS